jgi:hypothetical protein
MPRTGTSGWRAPLDAEFQKGGYGGEDQQRAQNAHQDFAT